MAISKPFSQGPRNIQARPRNLAGRVRRYIEGLIISQGAGRGEPFRVLPWERRFVNGAFATGIDTGAASAGRGNGKSALLAGIGAAFIDPEGPLHQPRGEAVVIAPSLDQGRRYIFADFKAFVRPLIEKDRRRWRISDNKMAAEITDSETGASFRVVACDSDNLHGMRGPLFLLDECARWKGGGDEALAAVETARGKLERSLLLAISTRSKDPAHWFSEMIDNPGPGVYSQLHRARKSDPPFHRRTWLKANPSLDHMPELEKQIRLEADRAKRDPKKLAAFRALRLNLGVSETAATDPLLEFDVFEEMSGGTTRALKAGAPVFGVDLGATAAMSAVSAYWPDSGRLECMAAFPKNPELAERGKRDGVRGLYQTMHQRGELVTLGAYVVPVGELIEAAAERYGVPSALVADRWKDGEILQGLSDIGLSVPVVFRGQGFRDGAADVHLFRVACIERRVIPEKSLLLAYALSEAVTVSDPAGNAKLAKATQGGRRRRARDDAAAASILAVAQGERQRATPVGGLWWDTKESDLQRAAG